MATKCNSGKNHPKFIDLTNKVIKQLTIVKYVNMADKKGQTRWVWKCICECGNTSYVRTTKLTGANPQTSCKVCSNKRHAQKRVLDSFLSLRNRIYKIYKKGAEKRGYIFNLTFEEADSLMQENCHYCDEPPVENIGDQTYTYGQGVFKRNGIDRLDNTQGYITSNVVACCSKCNIAKMDNSENDFYNWIQKVYHNLKLKKKFND